MDVLFYSYMFKLLTTLGFVGAWDHCQHSDQKINLASPYYLSLEDAALLPLEESKHSDLKLSPSVIKWVNYIQKNDLSECIKVHPNQKERADVFLVLKSILGTILTHPFKSESFLNVLN